MCVSFTTSGEIFPVKAAIKINSSNEQHLTAMFQKFSFTVVVVTVGFFLLLLLLVAFFSVLARLYCKFRYFFHHM